MGTYAGSNTFHENIYTFEPSDPVEGGTNGKSNQPLKELADRTEFLRQLALSMVPAGTVSAFAGASAPSGYLLCDGSEVSRTTYADLFAVIGENYGAGDGSTTFLVPDLRGEFIRGFDAGRGIDTGRVLGSFQADEFKSHIHDAKTEAEFQSGTNKTGVLGGGATPDSNAIEAAGGNETRPRNIAMNFIIRY